jgi:TPR repeat protein
MAVTARDLEAAHRHLQAAAEGGSTHAVRIRANLTANGGGRDADPAEALAMLKRIAGADPAAAAQLALLPLMMSEADAGEAQRQPLSVDPSIELVRALLLPEECDYLIGLAEPALKPSHIDDPGSFYGKG